MAFTYLKLTTFGQNLDAKCKLGKGLHLSRVAIGDGLLGSGSMVNRTALVSEKFSMLIDTKQLTEEGTVAAIISTLDNSGFTEGFSYRELGVMGVDPDTSQEGLYLYDNAGEECEYLDTQANGVTIYERLKLLIKTEDIDSITFDASGNPLYITFDEKGAADGVASLDANGKVPSEQLPTMNFEAPIKDQAAKATPVDADQVPIIDSADDSKTKRVLWSAIKAALGNVFAALTHSHTKSDITDFPTSMTPSAHASTHKTGGSDPIAPGDIGAASEELVNTGWNLLQEYTVAGSYTWEAPDLFGGDDYYIGVCIIGAGGSGGVGFANYSNGYNAGGLGGSSGYAKSCVLKVTPGNTYTVVVGAGGASVSKSSAGYTNGNTGGSSAFNGKTALGGGGGRSWNASGSAYANPADGGQVPSSFYAGSIFTNQNVPFGGKPIDLFVYQTPSIITLSQDAISCFNPFKNKRILGAGANSDIYVSTGANYYTTPPGLSDDSIGGGTESHGINGTFVAGDATDNGCGGGAASGSMSSSATTLTSGKGGDGAVEIYVQGAVA